MQKRAKIAIEFMSIGLDDALPIYCSKPFEQFDSPIRHLHFHDCLEIGFCSQGNGIFVVGDKVLPFGAGDVSFIGQTEVHLARSAPGTTSHWVWIYLDPVRLCGLSVPASERGDLDPHPFSGSGFCNIIQNTAQPRVAPIVKRLIEELREPDAPSYASMLRVLVWQLMIEMGRLIPASNPRTPLSRPHYDRLAPALSRLANAHQETPSSSELAALCGLSEAHFRRLFRATLGRGPREYAFDVRMRLAASLLRGTTQSILSISHDTGFDSLSSFNRVFRKSFGMAPRQWRQLQTQVKVSAVEELRY